MGASAPIFRLEVNMSEIQQHQHDPIAALVKQIDTLSLAAKGVKYIKQEFKETKDFDADNMFNFVCMLMSDSSKVNTLVMNADPVVLSSIQYFVHWYATSIDSENIPSQLRSIQQHRLEATGGIDLLSD